MSSKEFNDGDRYVELGLPKLLPINAYIYHADAILSDVALCCSPMKVNIVHDRGIKYNTDDTDNNAARRKQSVQALTSNETGEYVVIRPG